MKRVLLGIAGLLALTSCNIVDDLISGADLLVEGPAWLEEASYEVYSGSALYRRDRVRLKNGSALIRITVPANPSLKVEGLYRGEVYYRAEANGLAPGTTVRVRFDEGSRRTISPALSVRGLSDLVEGARAAVAVCALAPVGYPSRPSEVCPDGYEEVAAFALDGNGSGSQGEVQVTLPYVPEYYVVSHFEGSTRPIASVRWTSPLVSTWSLDLGPRRADVRVRAPGWVDGLAWAVLWNGAPAYAGAASPHAGEATLRMPVLPGARFEVLGSVGPVPYYRASGDAGSYPSTLVLDRSARITVTPTLVFKNAPEEAAEAVVCAVDPADWDAVPGARCPAGYTAVVARSTPPYSFASTVPLVAEYRVFLLDGSGSVLRDWTWTNANASVWTFDYSGGGSP